MTIALTALTICPSATADPPVVKTSAAFYSARCHDAYQAVRWYRARYDEHRTTMGMTLAPPVEQGMDCRRLRERAAYWVQAAKVNRIAAATWVKTIHERTGWLAAVDEVQRAFPGTAGWLQSCADAEGWNRSTDTRWVIFGGGPYYPGAEYSYNGHLPQVGGPMQYMWSTFKGHYRHGLESLRSRGFIVRLPAPSDVRAWLSMTAQAIAAGWARWAEKDDSHWSASWGRGC